MSDAEIRLNQLEKRILTTQEQIRRFRDAFSARGAELRPYNVPEWAWKAEIDGITSILADLQVELYELEQERWKCGLST